MSQCQKVIWTEGALLSQQHLQTWDRYLEQQLRYMKLHFQPYPWGVYQLSIDKQALFTGEIKLLALKAVLPNGYVIDYDYQNDAPLSFCVAEQQRGLLFLALPPNDAVQGINGYPEHGFECRWSADYQSINDVNDPKRQQEVLLAKHNLFLTMDSQQVTGRLSLPLAKVLQSQGDQVSLDMDYIPPSIKLEATDAGLKQISRLLQQGAQLIEHCQNKKEAIVLTSGIRIYPYLQLSQILLSLHRSLSQFEHFQQTGKQHPLTWYQVLRQVCTEILSLAGKEFPPMMAYEHCNLQLVFNELSHLLQQAVADAIPNQITVLPIDMLDDHHGQVNLQQLSSIASQSFYLALRLKHSTAKSLSAFTRQVKLAAPSDMSHLIKSSSSGITLNHIPDLAIQTGLNTQFEYFSLHQQHSLWPAVMEQQQLMIFLNQALIDCQLQLIAIDQERT